MFSKSQHKHLILSAIFFLLALIVWSVENFSANFSGKNGENFSEISVTENNYISSLQGETQEKVLQILEDAEVQKTLDRIEKSDEYYNKDGAIFMNREKKLPIKSDREYYAEWTVKTP